LIPKSEVLTVAGETQLLATTVEKDYVLGWVLFGISAHAEMQKWLFKGGTCLKKCYFETYRFSEDLDFTIPSAVPYEPVAIKAALGELTTWVRDRSGIEFPAEGIELEELENKRGKRTYQAKLTFGGPLQLAKQQQQRVKLDLTQDEIVIEPGVPRAVDHAYSDAPTPRPQVLCYTLDEILAEKTRALYERSGRSRDVYDVVNIDRNFRSEVSETKVRELVRRKFEFKGIALPGLEALMARIDAAVLEVDWKNALGHQLPMLPPAADFLVALREAASWLVTTIVPPAPPPPVPGPAAEHVLPVLRFPRSPTLGAVGLGRTVPAGAAGAPPVYSSRMDRIRYAARNRLLARVRYHGVARLVEPYSLRMPKTGNLLLYVFETQRGTGAGGGIKAFKVAEIGDVEVTSQAFNPRFLVEL
jgi:predicted nucleotidyltransferase component of viral defense system